VKRPSNRGVVEKFLAGRRAMSTSLATDGESVWSYMVPIARRTRPGGIVMTRESGRYWSRTTSYHCHLVAAVARCRGFTVEQPPDKEVGD
jgi:hypothetical protein